MTDAPGHLNISPDQAAITALSCAKDLGDVLGLGRFFAEKELHVLPRLSKVFVTIDSGMRLTKDRCENGDRLGRFERSQVLMRLDRREGSKSIGAREITTADFL